MTVNSVQEAWKEVDRIFPTDYEKDEEGSQRAGYTIYRSTAAEGQHYNYICDLNDRLEINLSNGKTINIWIVAQPEREDTQIDLDVEQAANILGRKLFSLYGMETYTKIRLIVDGSMSNRDETERRVWGGLRGGEDWLATVLVASYCNNNGIRCEVIEELNIDHYKHANKAGVHFIITAYVGSRAD